MQKYYLVSDRPTTADLDKLGLKSKDVTGPLHSLGMGPSVRDGKRAIRAKYTGQKRPPRKGEWYLSGSTPTAWRAPNDLTTPYHIARLVLIEETVVETVVEIA